MGKDCGCGKHDSPKHDRPKETFSCQSVLSGTFTTVDGKEFSATMSATGSGKTCESAKKNSEKNIEKTLENFLNCYKLLY